MESENLSTEMYRFDAPDLLTVLDGQTTARGRAAFLAASDEHEPILRIALLRHLDDPDEVRLICTLPLVAVDGHLGEFELDVVGDGSGCEPFLEAVDGTGQGLTYAMGRVDFQGTGTCRANVQRPSRRWGATRTRAVEPGVVLPLQLVRIGFAFAASCGGFDVGLRALRVTGSGRLVSTGIAGA